MTDTIYPEAFRLPEWQGHQYLIDMGVHRSAGFTAPEQRRTQTLTPLTMQAVFVMPSADVPAWIRWVNEYGAGWFLMPLQSMRAAGAQCSQERMRITSAPVMETAEVFGFQKITVEMEQAP